VTALIAAAALGLHQLRYLLPVGHSEPAAGHSYLPFAGLAAVFLLAGACAQLLRIVSARRGGGTARPLSFRRAWPLAALALFAIFAGQELLEGWLSSGRPGGEAAVFASGGWVAIPLAVAFGALVAAFLAGARAVVRVASRRRRHSAPRTQHPALSTEHARERRPAFPVLAANLAGRAPPLAADA
jgi:hypothetical protein